MKHRIKALIFIISIIALLSTPSCKKAAPLTASDYLTLGERYLLTLDYEQAVVQYQNLIEIEPSNPRGYLGLAIALNGLGKTGDAITTLQQGFNALPGNYEFLSEAADIYIEIIGAAPNDPEAYLGLFDVYEALGETDHALDALESGFVELNNDFGYLDRSAGRYERVIATDPYNPDAYLGLYDVLDALGNQEEAVETVITGHALIPGNAKLGDLYARLVGSDDSTMTPPPPPTPPSQPTPLPTITPSSPAPSPVPIPTPTSTSAATASPTPSASPSASPSPTPSNTPSASPSPSPTPTSTPTATPTTTPTPTTTTPTPALVAPTISVGNSTYHTEAGTDLYITLNVTGSQPLTIDVQGFNERGQPVPGFMLDNGTVPRVYVAAWLSAGTYSVTVTATNDAGSRFVIFRVEVAPEAPAAVAPLFTVMNSSYSINQGGGSITLSFTLTGTDPVSLSMSAVNTANNSPVSGFSMGSSGNILNVGERVVAGHYRVTLTATNDAGTDVANFSVEVISTTPSPTPSPTPTPSPSPAGSPPEFTVGTPRYSIALGSRYVVLDFTLTGTEPITTWIEVQNSSGATVSGFSIGSSINTIMIASEVTADTYTLTLYATNSAGRAAASFHLGIA